MTLSLETLLLLLRCLDAQQMQVGDPEFEETAERVLVAKRELRAVIDDATSASAGHRPVEG